MKLKNKIINKFVHYSSAGAHLFYSASTSIKVAVYLLVYFLVFSEKALAVNFTITTIAPNIPGTNANSTPGQFISALYTWSLSVGGLLALGAIVYGGIKYTLSAGNPSGQNEGKEWVKAALLGLFLLLGAYLILYTINPNMVNLNLPSLQPV